MGENAPNPGPRFATVAGAKASATLNIGLTACTIGTRGRNVLRIDKGGGIGSRSWELDDRMLRSLGVTLFATLGNIMPILFSIHIVLDIIQALFVSNQ